MPIVVISLHQPDRSDPWFCTASISGEKEEGCAWELFTLLYLMKYPFLKKCLVLCKSFSIIGYDAFGNISRSIKEGLI
jgi:hypothetical protein